MPRNENTTSKRLFELDVLRALAVLAVIVCHYTSACKQFGLMASSFEYGSYGPHLFFVISGFVIFLTLNRTKTAKDFLVSRFSRLYPIYWVAVPFAFLAFFYFPLPGEHVTLGQMLANLTMLQTWLNVPDLDVSYWTLGVELKFYALMLGLFVLGLHRRIDVVLGAWLAAILGFWFAINVLTLPLPHALGTPLNVNYGHLFIAGILFYQLKNHGSTFYRHAMLACCLATQAVLGNMESTIAVSLVFAIFYAFTYNRLGWISTRPLVFLGAISYTLYLFHQPIGNIVIVGLKPFIASPTLLMSIAFVATLLVSTAATYLIERPSISLIRGWYKSTKKESRPVGGLLLEKG